MRLAAALALLIALHAASAGADETPPPSIPADSNHRVSLRLSFAHWFSGALGQPDGYLTPAISVGVRPGVRFLEVGARYTVAPGRLTLASGARSVVGFASLEVVAAHELRRGNHGLRLAAGLLGALVHEEQSSVGYGFGVTFGAELTFVAARRGDLRLGPFVGVREIFYTLPGEPSPSGLTDGWHRDAQIDLGVVVAFL